MKKTSLIIIGITAVLVLFAIWLYLLVYGTPTKVTEYFTDFSLFGGNTPTVITPIATLPETGPVVVDVKKDALRQLTTRPVVGFSEFTAGGSTTTVIRYAEAGTGHIYQIDLNSGEEARLSNVTVPNAELAVFSPDGTYVAIRSGFGANNEIILVTLVPNADATAENLAPKMTDFAWSYQNEIRYTEVTPNGLAGRILNPITKTTRNSFTVPFQSATIIWGTGSSTTYVYPKASTHLQGYLYAIKNGGMYREPVSGFGLIADANNRYIISTVREGTTPKSYSYDIASSGKNTLSIVIEPSKCAFSRKNPDLAYCGSQFGTTYSERFPDDWYKGIRSFSDKIWLLDLKKQSATELIDPTIVTGRDIDMMSTTISDDSQMLYFTNKNDNTLWLYDMYELNKPKTSEIINISL